MLQKIKKLSFPLIALCLLFGKMIPASAGSTSISCGSFASLPIFEGKPEFRYEDLIPSFDNTESVLLLNEAFTALPVSCPAVTETSSRSLCADGSTFGVRLFTEGVMVVGVSEGAVPCPAYAAGMKASDLIIGVNGKKVNSVNEVINAINQSAGDTVTFLCRRDKNEISFELKPAYDEKEQKYKAGLLIRDNAAGIGTVTFIDTRTGAFGGLGHGICDSDTGILIPLSRGAVMPVQINGIVKGVSGKPGELHGSLTQRKIGTLLSNTDCGVFGVLSPVPSGLSTTEVGDRTCVHTGKAYIRCALGDVKTKDYEIKITEIDRSSKTSKCFALTVTDRELLSKTGGIIQGMSGSPVIQDGKLIGAVTHVLIGDPSKGFGIFLENMLSAMPERI